MHMHSHGSFASLPLIWYWEYTRNATFLTDQSLATADPTATPYALVRGLAEWWVCHLTKEEAPTAKDGYVFSDLDDCAYEDSNYCKHEDSLTLTRESSATSLRNRYAAVAPPAEPEHVQRHRLCTEAQYLQLLLADPPQPGHLAGVYPEGARRCH